MNKISPDYEFARALEMDSEKNLESQIQSIQKLTYEERIAAHENALKLFNELQAIGKQIRDQS